ncbi:MAG: hypothetical protein PF518_18940 [Spirochaetaceae bacterium]|jgi:hypothetical protein|nr:hypothetical protein [Spirochaetaceae bacterium]
MADNNQTLINEIQKNLKVLDRESLLFLKEQVSVLIYNKEVREQNKNKKPGKTKSLKSVPSVYFEQIKNGKFFNLCIENEKIFMDFHEIKSMLKIAKAAESPEAGATRLYNWLKKERKDVLVEGHITSSGHPFLLLIYKELLDTFQ